MVVEKEGDKNKLRRGLNISEIAPELLDRVELKK
jgi:hypothetical protein